MSSVLGMLPYVGGAIEGLCGLGSTLVDGIIGPEGLFARVLDGLSGDDGADVKTDDAVALLEQRLQQLEQLIAERRGMLAQQADLMAMNDKLARVAKALAQTTLSTEGREAVMTEVTAFLSNRNVAERLGTAAPDEGELSTRLEAILKEHNVLGSERVPILQQVGDILNNVEEQIAA